MIASYSEGEEESLSVGHWCVWTSSPGIIRKSATQRASGRQAVLLRQAEAFEPVHQVAGTSRRIDDCFWSAGRWEERRVGKECRSRRASCHEKEEESPRRVWTNSQAIRRKQASLSDRSLTRIDDCILFRGRGRESPARVDELSSDHQEVGDATCPRSPSGIAQTGRGV